MTQPDITADEVINAANLIEKLSRIYEYHSPDLAEWSASDLRNELIHIREVERRQRNRREIARQVGDHVLAGVDVADAIRMVLEGYEVERIDP